MNPDLVLSEEEYNTLEDTMRTASMGAILVAEAGLSSNTVVATSKEVSAFLTLLESNLRFVYEGVTKRSDEAREQARATNEGAAAAAKERKAIGSHGSHDRRGARQARKYKDEQRAAGVEVGTQEAVDFALNRNS